MAEYDASYEEQELTLIQAEPQISITVPVNGATTIQETLTLPASLAQMATTTVMSTTTVMQMQTVRAEILLCEVQAHNMFAGHVDVNGHADRHSTGYMRQSPRTCLVSCSRYRG